VPTAGDAADKTLNRLDPMFMYTQIMKEILLTIKFEQKHFNEYIDYCRDIFAENEDELKNVDKLERQYHDETPIWWYTYECFLYPMLNRALRMSDVDKIIKMGFFVGDLHRHIEELHMEQFGDRQVKETFIVYRGQGLSKINFDQLMNTKGVKIAKFLSVSLITLLPIQIWWESSSLWQLIHPNQLHLSLLLSMSAIIKIKKMKFSFQCTQFFVFIILNPWIKIIVSFRWI
jgi:hypothetical protein